MRVCVHMRTAPHVSMCHGVMRMDGDDQEFGEGRANCTLARKRCSVPETGLLISLPPQTHILYTHMLTPSLKPISFAQGMGTPLISLLPLSSLPPHHPCPFAHPLSSCPSLFFLPSSPALSITCSPCPALTLSPSLVPPTSLTVLMYAEGLLSAHFYFLPPSVPNLS